MTFRLNKQNETKQKGFLFVMETHSEGFLTFTGNPLIIDIDYVTC